MSDITSEIGGLFDKRGLNKARRAAEEIGKDWDSGQIEYMRRRCKNDLFFLCHGPLEYTKLHTKFHGDLTRWIQRTRNLQHKLLLLARGHYKTTVESIGDSIQMSLPNGDGIIQEHPYTLGTNVKILIAHEVRETAADILFEITAAFTRKPTFMALFEDCIPTKNVERINKWQLELPRTEHHKEATFNTIGAGGAAQGGHYNALKLDDLIGEKARDSLTVMKTTRTWFNNINSLLTEFEIDVWRLTGTRWAFSDVYSHAMEVYGIDKETSVLNCISQREIDAYGGGVLGIYARGAIENGQPVFPFDEVKKTGFSLKKLAILRKDRLVWAAQYANNPEESGLNEFSWDLKLYNTDPHGNIVVFDGESSWKRRPRELSVYVFTDPSMGETELADDTGIIVVGIDQKFNIFILETVKKRLIPPHFVDEIFRLNFKYHPEIIAIEEVNFSGIYKYWIEQKATELRVHPPIRSYKPGSKRSKLSRIRGLSHFFSAGQVFIHEGMHDFRDEYEQFPMGKSEHLLDALAQGPEFWKKGLSQAEVDSQANAVEEILDDRSEITGY
ncbi:MAG: hypothetical protein V3T23_10185 [Nitrososphaerales archaeon]